MCYSILLYLYILIYRKTDISKAYISILTIQIILVTLIGILYFKESITTNKVIGFIADSISISDKIREEFVVQLVDKLKRSPDLQGVARVCNNINKYGEEFNRI